MSEREALHEFLVRFIASNEDYNIESSVKALVNVERVNSILNILRDTSKWPVLKGVCKVDGDGYKNTDKKGDVVFVWNYELPAPYEKGQHPRIHCPLWTAGSDRFDFTEASLEDIRCFLLDKAIEEFVK